MSSYQTGFKFKDYLLTRSLRAESLYMICTSQQDMCVGCGACPRSLASPHTDEGVKSYLSSQALSGAERRIKSALSCSSLRFCHSQKMHLDILLTIVRATSRTNLLDLIELQWSIGGIFDENPTMRPLQIRTISQIKNRYQVASISSLRPPTHVTDGCLNLGDVFN